MVSLPPSVFLMNRNRSSAITSACPSLDILTAAVTCSQKALWNSFWISGESGFVTHSLYFLISSSASWCSIIGAMGLSVQPGISFASLARLGLQAPSFVFGSSTGCLLIFCGLLVIWFWRARFCRHARLPVGSHTRSAGPPREPQGIWSGPL